MMQFEPFFHASRFRFICGQQGTLLRGENCCCTPPRTMRSEIALVALQALKGSQTVDRYKLIWSDRPEFVRAAARYGATIVPFGAVGCEESSNAIMNSDNVVRLGSSLRRLQGRPPPPQRPHMSARKGVNADQMFENDLAMVCCPGPLCSLKTTFCAVVYKIWQS
jgi:hypothetical protein